MNGKIPDVSVCLISYNQKAYVRKAITSVLKQITEYDMEIIVVDDCSTDGTQNEIIKLQKEYPGKFKAILLDHNTYYSDNNAFTRAVNMAEGKYINIVECDDYFISKYKIDRQVRFLETHNGYNSVTCLCRIVDENGNDTNEEFSNYKRCTGYSIKNWASGVYPGQTASLIYVNPKYHNEIDWRLTRKRYYAGDQCKIVTLAVFGQIYCMQEYMTAYRHVKTDGNSFSATYKFNFSDEEIEYRDIFFFIKEYGGFLDKCYAEDRYFKTLIKGIDNKDIGYEKALEYCDNSKVFFTLFYFIVTLRRCACKMLKLNM